MTNGPRITIRTRNGSVHTRIQHGWFDVDGITAVIIILIIAAARFVWALTGIISRVLGRAIKIVSPIIWRLLVIILRWACHRTAGILLAFRAFYVP
jgi:hypothetical protein